MCGGGVYAGIHVSCAIGQLLHAMGLNSMMWCNAAFRHFQPAGSGCGWHGVKNRQNAGATPAYTGSSVAVLNNTALTV